MSGPMSLYPESCRQPSRHLATYHRSTDASARPTGALESGEGALVVVAVRGRNCVPPSTKNLSDHTRMSDPEGI